MTLKNLLALSVLIFVFAGCTSTKKQSSLKPIYYTDTKTLLISDLRFKDTVREKHIVRNLDFDGRTGKVYSSIEHFVTSDKICHKIYSQHNQAKDGYSFKTDFVDNLKKKYNNSNCIYEKVSDVDFIWCSDEKSSEYRVVTSVKNDKGFQRATSLVVGPKCYQRIKKHLKKKIELAKKQ